MSSGILYAKKVPNFIAYRLIIAINSAGITQLISKGNNLHLVCSCRKPLNGFFLAKPPAFFTALALENDIGLRLHKTRHPFTEFPFNILERHIRIFHRIVEYSRSQKFLVVCHGGGNGDGFHRVDDIRETLPLAFCPLVRLDRKNNRFVEN